MKSKEDFVPKDKEQMMIVESFKATPNTNVEDESLENTIYSLLVDYDRGGMWQGAATKEIMQLIAARERKAVEEAIKPPLDLNAYENQLQSQVSVEDAFNLFIKKWCPHYAHLIDTDDNDGEYMRELLRELTSTKDKS